MDQILPTALLLINVICLFQCPGIYNAARLRPVDPEKLSDKTFQLRFIVSAADAATFGAPDFCAPKGTKAANILLLKSGTASYRLRLVSDGGNLPSNRDAEARLIAAPCIVAVALAGGAAAQPYELVVTLVIERPGDRNNRAEGRHTLNVDKHIAGALAASAAVSVDITKPRGGEKKHPCTPFVGAVESAAPPCKRCKQLEQQVASFEKMKVALGNDKAETPPFDFDDNFDLAIATVFGDHSAV
jgi:hypothetical protein